MVASLEGSQQGSLNGGYSGFLARKKSPKEPQLEILPIVFFSMLYWNVTLPDGASKILRVMRANFGNVIILSCGPGKVCRESSVKHRNLIYDLCQFKSQFV